MSRKKKPGKNTPLAYIFFSLIIGIILLSFLAKAFLVFKDSKFGDSDTYSIFLSNKKQYEVMTFYKTDNSVSIIKVEGKIGDIYKFLEIPVSAVYEDAELDLNKSVSSISTDILFSFPNAKSSVNVFDAIRIFLMSKSINPTDINTDKISYKQIESERDNIASIYFSDRKIEDEKLSIEVVNMSQEQGVGSRVARLLTNMGASVVLVSTGENGSSAIYAQESSYTQKKIGKVLNFPFLKGRKSKIADLTVIIGTDYDKLSVY
ncbi:MAG: LytR C-terminal domain-containing protein [Patescibacteria group bacterium]